jgi:outer membrane protein
MTPARTARAARRALPVLSVFAAAVLAAHGSPARAESLQDVYDAARGYDAAFQSARALHESNVYRAAQNNAGLLPVVALGAGATTNRVDYAEPAGTPARGYDTTTMSLTATQPLYRPANAATYSEGDRIVAQSQAQLQAAEQDLIVRVSQSYFDVLNAQDTLTSVLAQKAAVAEQLASAQRNFEVGTATITDTREAQSRADLVLAQEISATNDLRVKRLALDQLVGRTGLEPDPLAPAVTLPFLAPDGLDEWVRQAVEDHPLVRQARMAVEIAQLEVDRVSAGHKPTLDLVGSYSVNRNINGSATGLAPTATVTANVGSLGVVFNLPLFSGMLVQNQVRQNLSLQDKARSDLDNAQRTVAQATRSAYLGVVSSQGQVRALEAAESSSRLSLESNVVGYRVGVRINIDVLNAQSQLYQTQRDLAKARYDVLVGGLKLRQANGTLKEDDLRGVNALLVARSSRAPVPADGGAATQSR